MSIFDAYDSEFTSLSQDISRNISDFKQNISNAGKSDVSTFIDLFRRLHVNISFSLRKNCDCCPAC